MKRGDSWWPGLVLNDLCFQNHFQILVLPVAWDLAGHFFHIMLVYEELASRYRSSAPYARGHHHILICIGVDQAGNDA